MKKVKALLFLPYLAPYRVNALNEIGKYYDLTVVFLMDNTISIKYDQDDLKSRLKVNYIYLTSGVNIRSRQIRYGIFKLLVKNQPQVVFSNEYGLTSLLISVYRKIGLFKYRHVSTTSDNVIMAQNSYGVRRFARNIVLGASDGLIVYNKETKDWYEDHFKGLSIKICPNIQNPDDLLQKSDIYRKVAKEYQQEYRLKGKRVYLFIGRFHPIKGLDVLINNFSKIRRKDEVLILVGDGPLKKELKQQIISLGLEESVLLPGKFEGDKLFGWYKVADLFILPSVHEPFGAVVNESLILGTPVLCSSVAGATYFIEKRENGLIFNAKDDNDFFMKFNEARDIFKGRDKEKKNLMRFEFERSLKTYYDIYPEISRD